MLTGAFFVSFGAYQTTRIQPRHESDHFSHFYNRGDLVGVLLQKRISEKKGRLRFQARVISVGSRSCSGKIFASVEIDALQNGFLYGDTLWTRNSVYRIRAPLNPGGVDFQKYAARKNIVHQLYLRKGEFVLKPGNEMSLLRRSIQLNRHLQRVLESVLTEPGELAIAKALLLGDKNEMPEELLRSYKGAGAMHILAISGLHVGIVHLIFMFLTRPLILLRNGRILRLILILFGLWSYALLTGMAVSATRSVSMFTLFTLGQSMNRKTRLFNNLVNSAFVLLIVNPMFLFDVGFQLSYAALAGIAAGTVLFDREKSQKKSISRFQKYFLGLILVSCSAQFGVMPLSLYYFKQFSGLFLVSSLLLLPVLGLTLVFGYSVLAGSLIFEVPMVVEKAFQLWLMLINGTIDWLGSMDALIAKGVYFPIDFLISMSLSLILLVLGFLKRKSLFIFASGICLICMQALWIQRRIHVIRDEKLLVFQQRGESLVVRRKGSFLELKKGNLDSGSARKLLENYSSQLPGDFSIQSGRKGIGKESSNPVRLFYVDKSLVGLIDKKIHARAIDALDSLKRNPDIVVFSNAPRLNLDRLLAKIRPRIVVADGSNHKGFAKRCKTTCLGLDIEFHETPEKGAFVYPK